MPNHVLNILHLSGEASRMQQLFEAVKQDEIGLGSIDFEKVIPMPENIYRGNVGVAERAKYGKNNWYDWSIANWGTKWNSYGYESTMVEGFDGENIKFYTAGAPAEHVIRKVAKDYPDIEFSYQWADEDMGYNVGSCEYCDGEDYGLELPMGGSKEAIELANSIWGVDEDEDEGDA